VCVCVKRNVYVCVCVKRKVYVCVCMCVCVCVCEEKRACFVELYFRTHTHTIVGINPYTTSLNAIPQFAALGTLFKYVCARVCVCVCVSVCVYVCVYVCVPVCVHVGSLHTHTHSLIFLSS